MTTVHCQIETPPRSEAKPLTVGDPFKLLCDGDMGAALKENAHIAFADDNQKYSIYALRLQESTPQSFQLIVTSYQAGDHNEIILKISDGVTTVESQPLSWHVESVLDTKEQPKPFPSKGPFLISYPLWLWLVLGAVALSIGGLIFYFVHQRRQRQKLRAELESYATMLPPFSQYSRDMRTFSRQLSQAKDNKSVQELVAKIDEYFRLYLIRELMVPALQVSDREVLKAIRREHRQVYEEYKVDLIRTLSELTNAKKNIEKIKMKDAEDLSFLCRSAAEKVFQLKRKSGS